VNGMFSSIHSVYLSLLTAAGAVVVVLVMRFLKLSATMMVELHSATSELESPLTLCSCSEH